MKKIGFLLLLLPQTALAQDQRPALHNKSWYKTHAAERAVTLRLCHSDATYSDLNDCQNAEAASAVADLPWNKRGNGLGFMQDPAYWRANPLARDATLVQCSRRARGDEQALPYCAAAAAGR